MNYQIQSKRIVADTVTNHVRKLPDRNRSAILQYLFCALLSFFITTVAQAQLISINVQNAPITRVLEQIRKQSGHDFVYDGNVLKNGAAVSLNLRQASLGETLRSLFVNQPFTYEINDKVITILPKKRASAASGAIQNGITANGTVRDSLGKPLSGATVRLKGTQKLAFANADGHFVMKNIEAGAPLLISFIQHQTLEVGAAEDMGTITLNRVNLRMEVVDVNVNTGYQSLSPERTTGSFVKPDKVMFDSRVSTDVISRLEGITSGLVFNAKGTMASGSDETLSIRGRSTIYANAQPLIVVDNFPYEGDFNNLNPNDIEDITVLKDAAAASIWGARAGNGVIVITTKKGARNQPVRLSLTANTTVSAKPDLKYDPNFISSSSMIDLEKDLFERGYYNSKFTNAAKPLISPVVALLYQAKNGLITQQEVDEHLDQLRGIDTRDELSRHFYRNAVNQQYALNVLGGSDKHFYYLSGGYDKNANMERENGFERFTLSFDNTFTPFKNLNINAGINYVQGTTTTDNTLSSVQSAMLGSQLPYTSFTDDNGNPSSIAYGFSQLYTQNIQDKGFLDWRFYPLEELNNGYNQTSNQQKDIRIWTGIDYNFFKGLKGSVKYQYQKGITNQRNLAEQESYFTRNLINRYSTLDASGNVNGYNIPLGAILTRENGYSTANNIRGQLDYVNSWQDHAINAIVGIEAREITTESENFRYYGYDDATATFGNVNTTSNFPINPSGTGTVGAGLGAGGTLDRFRSFYANVAYTYKDRYTLTGSARIDQSNLFGVRTNQKSVPLWSAGLRWDINKESFYHVDWLPKLSLRSTYGYNGNMDKSVTAVTTFQLLSVPANSITGLRYAIISNIGNPDLRWERIGLLNLGVDFSLKNNVVSGTIEYFHKTGKDLIGDQLMPHYSGVTKMRGNYAKMKGSGLDVQLNSRNMQQGIFRWESSLLLSKAIDKITEFSAVNVTPTVSNGRSISPLIGKPVYHIRSYRWAGLDPETGNPQGYDDEGNISQNYAQLTRPTSFDELVYNGSARPTLYGGLRNTFAYGALDLSFNISFKLGHYFRRNTIIYNTLFTGYKSHEDYDERWQHPGDELATNVPSLVYPTNTNRDNFYSASEIMVEKGDHIRLQDVALSYRINSPSLKALGVSSLQVGVYANNIGLLWKATKTDLDPDFPVGGIRTPRTIAFSVKAGF